MFRIRQKNKKGLMTNENCAKYDSLKGCRWKASDLQSSIKRKNKEIV